MNVDIPHLKTKVKESIPISKPEINNRQEHF
jgi:hypothetical protein